MMRQTPLSKTRIPRAVVPLVFLLTILALGLLAACSTESASEPKSMKIDLEQSQSDAAAKAAKELEAQKKAEAEKEAEEAKKKAEAEKEAEAKAALEAEAKKKAEQANTCLGGRSIPAGIDPIACGPMPGNVMSLPTYHAYGAALGGFDTPSGNISCWLKVGDTREVSCLIREVDPSVQRPSTGPDSVANMVHYTPNGWEWGTMGGIPFEIPQPVPVIPYGQTASFLEFGFISTEEGLIMWDTTNGAGARLSRAGLITW